MKKYLRLSILPPPFTPVQRLGKCWSRHPSPRIQLIPASVHHSSILSTRRCSNNAYASAEMLYKLPRLDNVEDVEKYRRGGFHPIHLADTFQGGRYHILHKLGYGGSSTAWLAHDQVLQRLVSLKVLTADASHQQKELNMLRYLDQNAQGSPRRDTIISILDSFTFEGPNGTHMCYVSPVGGPSIAQLLDSPGQVAGSRRLRADLARKLAEQLASAVCLLHSLGITHGDITPKNVLLRLANIDEWSSDDVIRQLDSPVKDEVFKFSGGKPGISAPEYVVQPTSFSSIAPRYISEKIILIDLGEAFLESVVPPKGVGTPVSYCSPELILKGKPSRWSDVWALSCTMFEMRSGFPLFESFVGSASEVFQEMVRILGTPPKSWSPFLEQHDIFIDQNDAPYRSLLDERIAEIGMNDETALGNGTETPLSTHPTSEILIEPSGRTVPEGEANALADLLQKSLNYTPEERLPADVIARHRWFAGTEVCTESPEHAKKRSRIPTLQ